MKNFFIILLIMGATVAPAYSQSNETEEPGEKLLLETDHQRVSYTVGYRLGIRLQPMIKHNDIDLATVIRGIKDAAAARPRIPEQEMIKMYARFKDEQKKREEERQKIQAHKNKTEGEQFLKDNAAKEGIVVTPSGLQYRVLKEGTGPLPQETDIAAVHYRGTLIDGTEVFDSYKRGQPVKLPLKRVLPFWKEGLLLMKVGAKYRFFIPPDLAYRQFGQPPSIGPHAVLVYEAELLGIEK